MVIRQQILSMEKDAKMIRRSLHKIPEEGFKEIKTSQYIMTFLRNLGIEDIIQVAVTGVVAVIKGNNDKETIAFRADMDGLSVEEKNSIDYASSHKGLMHACGHDGHMTILLLLVKYIIDNGILPDTNIMFIFQPAEEGPGGAREIIQSGILEKYQVKRIYGCHIMPSLNEGIIGCKEGPLMAQTGEVYITVKGKSSHAAVPHRSTDAIMIASNLINTLQTIVSRNMDPIETTLFSIGTIQGGSRVNVIAEKVQISGTMRAFSEETYNAMTRRLLEIIQGYEKTFNCKINCKVVDMYPPVINDVDMVQEFKTFTKGFNTTVVKPMMIAEDFSYYQKHIPGLFFYIGSKNVEKQYVYDLHDSQFNFDEKILLNVVEIYAKILQYER
ncbi:MAG: M20 metallopeptidase family protein [Eubacteriales bacterium]